MFIQFFFCYETKLNSSSKIIHYFSLLFHLGRAQDYFCSTHGLEYVFSLSKTVKESDLSQAALRTLAMATEGNGNQISVSQGAFHLTELTGQTRHLEGLT